MTPTDIKRLHLSSVLIFFFGHDSLVLLSTHPHISALFLHMQYIKDIKGQISWSN